MNSLRCGCRISVLWSVVVYYSIWEGSRGRFVVATLRGGGDLFVNCGCVVCCVYMYDIIIPVLAVS